MSVINSMLKDLDKRQQPHSLENLNVAPVQYRGKPASKLPWILLTIVSVLLIAGIAYSWVKLSEVVPATSTDPSALKEPLAANEPSASKEPLANSETFASSEPSASKESLVSSEPLAANEPSASNEPSAPKESLANSEPLASNESSVSNEPSANSELLASNEPSANSEPSALNKPSAEQRSSARDSAAVQTEQLSTQRVTKNTEVAEPKASMPKASSMAVKEVQVSNEQLAQRRYHLASEAENQGLLSDAVIYYSEVLALKPEMHAARRQLAALYYGQNKLGLASDTLTKGIALFPQEYDYAILLARVQRAAGKSKQALATLELISDQSPHAKQKWTMQSSLALPNF